MFTTPSFRGPDPEQHDNVSFLFYAAMSSKFLSYVATCLLGAGKPWKQGLHIHSGLAIS